MRPAAQRVAYIVVVVVCLVCIIHQPSRTCHSVARVAAAYNAVDGDGGGGGTAAAAAAIAAARIRTATMRNDRLGDKLVHNGMTGGRLRRAGGNEGGASTSDGAPINLRTICRRRLGFCVYSHGSRFDFRPLGSEAHSVFRRGVARKLSGSSCAVCFRLKSFQCVLFIVRMQTKKPGAALGCA